MLFLPGLPEPAHAQYFDYAFISINRLRRRRGAFVAPRLGYGIDGAAFTEMDRHGYYRHSPEEYAAELDFWTGLVPGCLFAAAQDYMCERYIFNRRLILTDYDHTVYSHQVATVERYDRICAAVRSGVYILPVLQGYAPWEYVSHIDMYGSRLAPGAWVGVGSVCKRQGDVSAILAVLRAVKSRRPDLRLHGFGVKQTALDNDEVRSLLFSADSMAWSFSARKQGRNANDWREAQYMVRRIADSSLPPLPRLR